MVLEDLLRDDTRSRPLEAARQMLEFIKTDLKNGGQQANTRFFNLIVPLCQSILGKIGGKDEGYLHLHGGWLDEQDSWIPKRKQAIPTLAGGTRQKDPEPERDFVVELLGTANPDNNRYDSTTLTLIEALSLHAENYRGVYLEFPFLALPRTMQDAWLDVIARSLAGTHAANESMCSKNDNELLMNLRKKPSDQQGTIQFFNKRKSQVLTPRHQPQYPNNPGLFHTPPQSPTFSPAKPSVADDVPMILVTVLEYFLLSFLRYPLFLPDPTMATSSISSTIPGANVHHIPGQNTHRMHLNSNKKRHGHDVYLTVFQLQLQFFLRLNRVSDGFANADETDLFLCLIIALWFESTVRLSPESKAQTDWTERHKKARLSTTAETNLSASHDLTQLNQYPFKTPSRLMLSGIRKLVLHLIRLVPAIDHVPPLDWNIEPFMAKIQQPFYNFIRGCLRFTNLSSRDSQTFIEALDVWLIWLEPWNRKRQTNHLQFHKTKKAKISIKIPHHDHKSMYDASWEPYIAANLFIYMIPLAIFIRRARELDFTSSSSLETVSKVFRVFTPEVINVMSRHVHSMQPSRLLEQHKQLLGEFCPAGKLQLLSLEGDLRKLFEDIDSRRSKTNALQSMFESGTSKINHLKERAVVIAQLPIGTDLCSGKRAGSTAPGRFEIPRPDRLPNGDLSELGKEQIRKGLARCSPDEITYIGDPMRRMPRSREVAILVWLFVKLSDHLSDFFGLSKETPGYRVNLRWFADYRHLLLAVVVAYAVTAFVC